MVERQWSLALVLVAALASGCTPERADPAAGTTAATNQYQTQGQTAQGPFREVATEVGLDFHHFNGMSGDLHMAEILGPGAALFDYDNHGDLDIYLVQGAMLAPGKSLADAIFPPRQPGPLTDRLYRNDLVSVAGGRRVPDFVDVSRKAGLTAELYGMGIAAGDFDNDGHIDLYITNWGSNQLLRNLGDGTFKEVTQPAGAGDPRWSVPAAFFDYDGDGWLDLYVGNYVDAPRVDPPTCQDPIGAPDYCGPDTFSPLPDRLLHNRGDGTFERATTTTGLAAGAPSAALGVLIADLDEDGLVDLYVANDKAPNHLWRNRGDGTFAEEAMLAGAAVNGDGKAEASMGVDAADYDGDGDLDLFMTHVIAESNTLYRNEGGGVFIDATPGSALGPPSRTRTGFGTGWIDFDGDGLLDLLVANGAIQHLAHLVRAHDPFPLHEPNLLFRNRGDGRFEPVPTEGTPLGRSEVSRAAAFGDIDNDGDVDVLLTQNNGPVRLLLNQGAPPAWIGVRAVAGNPARDQPGARIALLLDGQQPRWRRVRIAGSYCAANDPRVTFALQKADHVRGLRVRWPDGTDEDWPPPPSGLYTTLRRGTGTTATKLGKP